MRKILIMLLIIIIVGAGAFVLRNNILKPSAVPADWQAYKGDGFQFFCPKTFGLTVWKAVTRPPLVTIIPADQDPIAIGCPKLEDSAEITESGPREVHRISYSLYKGEDIGAGTLYTNMCYVFSGDKVNYVLNFEIRSHSGCENGGCGAYCGTEFEQECSGFDIMKDVIQPIEKMVSTFKIVK